MIDREELIKRRQEVLTELFKDNQTGRCKFLTETGECGLGELIGRTQGDEALEMIQYRGGEIKVQWWMLTQYLRTGNDYKDGLEPLDCRAILVQPARDILAGRVDATKWAMGGTLSTISTGMPEEGTCIGPNVKWQGK